MPNVTFLHHSEGIHVDGDTTILRAARELGIELAAPCGGNGTCGKCRVKANGVDVLACQTNVEGDMVVELPQRAKTNILTAGEVPELTVDPVKPGYLLAFDIGTTTVVCYLLSPEGQELAVESVLNPQASYGADVISRIQAAMSGEMDALTRIIREGMSDLIGKCCRRAAVSLSDIGTNGEMVLSHGGRMVACSTAAGPALEGANITFGMRGSTGAIDHVWAENGEIRCSVIGNGTPVGICGSGIIDAVATALELKQLNKRGRIQTGDEQNGQRVICLSGDVYLTQEDIRQVQLAKGAIAAGIHLMCGYLEITPDQIQQVILAGAFGSFLNPDSACAMELLPTELSGKITAAGNLAGAGAKMIAMSKGQFALTDDLRKRIEFMELADMPGFQKTFAKCMNLPQNA